MNIIDESATFRIVATLKLLLDEPDVYTRKQLAAKIGVNFDTVKKYFNMLRKAGFEVEHSDYPDYVYHISNLSIKYENDMKLNKEFLTTYSSKRHEKSYLTVFRTGRIRFPRNFFSTFEVSEKSKVGFEVKDDEINMIFAKNEDFELKIQVENYSNTFIISNSNLCKYLFDFYKIDINAKVSFRLKISQVDKDLFILGLL
jgi:biotin operon repressor